MTLDSLVAHSVFFDKFSWVFEFQNLYSHSLKGLQQIRIIEQGHSSMSGAQMLPVLRLPRMQLLVMDGFAHTSAGMGPMEKGEVFLVKTLAFFLSV